MSAAGALSTTDVVTATTDVGVEPARAFAVFTREIDAWWGDAKRPGTGPYTDRSGRLEFVPGRDGSLLEVFDDDRDPFEIGRVIEWSPPDRLVFEWRQGNFDPGQVTVVEIRFEAIRVGTRITLEHRGFDSLPADHSTRHGLGQSEAFVSMLADWWSERLARVAAFAERGADRPSR